MSDQPPVTQPAKPVALRTADERYVHVAQRVFERGGIKWLPEHVLALETKIKVVRTMLNQQKAVAPILPKKIGEDKNGTVHFYRVLIVGAPHTFVWSQICRGLISYRGPGEILATASVEIAKEAKA